MTGLWLVSYIALWILVLLLTTVTVSALRNLGVVYSMIRSGNRSGPSLRLSNMNQGDELPPLHLRSATDERRSTTDYRGRKVVFAVVSATCQGCWLALRSAFEQGPDPLDQELGAEDIVIVSLSEPDAAHKLLEKAGVPEGTTVLYDVQSEVGRVWGVNVTPYMVIVDTEMRVVRQVYGGEVDSDGPAAVALAAGAVEAQTLSA